ncbi:MAG: hypothetical protein U9R36_03915, partial [Elusimicrobiota bacterium]|nr:hypothetical protein [Elusimicrobiota bacterium]
MKKKFALILLYIVMATFGSLNAASFGEGTQGDFTKLYLGEAAWGDFDGDGDWDLAASGSTSATQTSAYIYRN